MTPSPGSLLHLVLPPGMAVVFRASADGAIFAREPLLPTDLAEVAAEMWLHCCLRRGYTDLPLAALPLRMLPRLAGDSRISSFDLEAGLPDGERVLRSFTIQSLAHVARRGLEPLIKRGEIQEATTFVYELACDAARSASCPVAAGSATAPRPVTQMPLRVVRRPLAPLLARAREAGTPLPEQAPVFVTESALKRAVAAAWHGIDAEPPVEAGGVLIGSLGWCEDAREFYVVVTDALEVREPEQTRYSLALSARDWAQVNDSLRSRQAAEPGEHYRLIGQFHAHPFRPMDGGEGGCPNCRRRSFCDLHSAFMSLDDQVWMQAHFRRQPWALSFIVGLTPRRTLVIQLFGLRDGRWQPRTFQIVSGAQGVSWQKNHPYGGPSPESPSQNPKQGSL